MTRQHELEWIIMGIEVELKSAIESKEPALYIGQTYMELVEYKAKLKEVCKQLSNKPTNKGLL